MFFSELIMFVEYLITIHAQRTQKLLYHLRDGIILGGDMFVYVAERSWPDDAIQAAGLSRPNFILRVSTWDDLCSYPETLGKTKDTF